MGILNFCYSYPSSTKNGIFEENFDFLIRNDSCSEILGTLAIFTNLKLNFLNNFDPSPKDFLPGSCMVSLRS
jgi:hypothetical protein